MRLALALLGLTLLVACRPDPALENVAPPEGAPAPVVRLINQRGTQRESATTLETEELRRGQTPSPTPRLTPRATGTRTTTPTPTMTPTVTPTGTVSPTVTRTPSVSPTPRQGPDIALSLKAFSAIDTKRARLTGPADVTQEFGGPDRMFVTVVGAPFAEAIVIDKEAWGRIGSFWHPIPSPPAHLVQRLDKLSIPPTLSQRKWTLRGVFKLRAGRCYDWELVDPGPGEPAALCLGVIDNLPYRVQSSDGVSIEFYDFDADIEVPDPYPVKG